MIPQEKYPPLKTLVLEIEYKKGIAIEITHKLIPKNGSIFKIHFFLLPLVNSTLNLLDAILDAFNKWNVLVVGSLLRNLLENAYLIVYLSNIPNSNEILDQFVKFGRIMKFKKGKWKKATEEDIMNFIEQFHNFREIYRDLCGFVHFSHKHITSCVKIISNSKDKNIPFKVNVGIGEKTLSEKELTLLLKAAISITELIYKYIEKHIEIMSKAQPL